MIVDFRVPDEPGYFTYIDRLMVFIIEPGYKVWLEGATTDAEAINVEVLPDLRFDGYWRGVHGYVSFGQEGGVVQADQPGVEEVTTRPLWFGCEFINWKQQVFVAPKHTKFAEDGREVLATGTDAFRIWLRPGVRAFVKVWTYKVDPFVGGGRLFYPNGTEWHGKSPP